MGWIGGRERRGGGGMETVLDGWMRMRMWEVRGAAFEG